MVTINKITKTQQSPSILFLFAQTNNNIIPNVIHLVTTSQLPPLTHFPSSTSAAYLPSDPILISMIH